MSIDTTIFAEYLTELARASSRAERTDVLGRYAKLFGVSVAHLRRQAKSAGFDFGYSKRKDAGKPRDRLMAKAAGRVCDLIIAANGRMPTIVAIDRARAIGWIPVDLDLPTWYVDRFIRDNGIRRETSKAPRETRKCKWGEPGRIVQADSTNCAQWFFTEPDGSIRYTERGEVYHNKPNKTPPIIRYMASDPTSGCFRVRYYQVDGERADTILDFLYWVFCRAEHPDKMPMAGVPETLVLDPGPGNMSAALKNLCESMGIEHRPHKPKHPWAKGSVEKHMDVWQAWFESELQFWPARDIDELNERAYLANIRFCSERNHSRHGLPRSEYYAARIGEIVLPPAWDIFVEAAHTTAVTRRVNGGCLISYEGFDYYVGGLTGCGTGDKVEVVKCVLDWSEEARPVRIRFGDQTIIENSLQKDTLGNYTDDRVYQKRGDAVIAEQEQRPAIALAEVRQTPAPNYAIAQQKSHPVPNARTVIRSVTSSPTRSRTAALLELTERLRRELTRFEVAQLGWSDRVSQQQIEMAASAMSRPTESGGMAASG